jgi:ribosomal protein L29
MSVFLFDTHAFVKRLTAAGMPEAQAEVLADQQAKLIDERLATKADIAGLATGRGLDDLRSDTKKGLDDLRNETKKGLDDLRSDTKKGLDDLRGDTKKELDDLRGDTKKGLDDLRNETKKGLDDLRSDTKIMLAETKADLLKWVIGTIGFQTLVILGAVLALSRAGH